MSNFLDTFLIDQNKHYENRKHKRIVCHAILGLFVSSAIKENIVQDFGSKYKSKSTKSFKLGEIEDKLQVNNAEMLASSMFLLIENKHLYTLDVLLNSSNAFDVDLLLETKGEDAYRDGYYLDLNQKEEVEQTQHLLNKELINSAKLSETANQSLIITNTSVRRLNRFLMFSNITALIFAAATGVFIALQLFKDDEPNLQPLNTRLEQTTQQLHSIQQSQKEIAASLRIMADSISHAHKP